MEMTTLKHPELVGLVMATIDKILHAEKGKVLEAEGVKLHPSEIHLLLFLEDHPAVNATQIAQRFSVTKGAVSQTLTRLERKGVLIKGRNPGSQTELDLSFTEQGRKLMGRLLGMRRAAERYWDDHMGCVSEADRKAIRRFLEGMQARFPPGH